MKYKIFSFLVAPVLSGAFSFSFVTTSLAQVAPPPVARPTPTPAQQFEIPENPRERRALAYSKLLEGQRYILMMRGASRGSAAMLTNSARTALQHAVTLEPKLAEAYTALGELALQTDLEESVRLFSKAVEADKNNFGAHFYLSRIYVIKSGLIREPQLDKTFAELAIRELKEIVRLDNKNAEGWAFLSEFYKAAGQKNEEIEALKNWADSTTPIDAQEGFYRNVTQSILTPDAASARLGEALIRAGKHDEAITVLSKAVSLNPEEEGYIDLLVEAFSESGDTGANTIAELKRLVATNPTNTKLIRLLSETQSRSGKIDDAITTLQNGIARVALDTESGETLTLQLALGEIYAEGFREKEALAVYEDILKRHQIETKNILNEEERQTAAVVFSRIISLNKNTGNFKDAEATIARLRKLFGTNDSSADEEGVQLLRDQGKRIEALQAIRTLRSRFPGHLNLAIQEAEILADLNRVDEGIAILRARLSTSDVTLSQAGNIQLNLLIASLYSQAKRGKEAIEAAQKAVSLVPQRRGERLLYNALSILASAQQAAGDFKGAEDSLRKILNDKPNDATALNNLGYFLVERNERLEEALSMIQKANRSEPKNSSFLDSLGWAYYKLGKYADAEKHLSEAARRNPFSATVQDHLGDTLQKLGKTDAARTAWTQALKLETDNDTIAKIKAKLNSKNVGLK